MLRRVQRQRQLYKNTFVTPGQRKDFGQMTDGQKAMLATLQFKFDPTPLPAPVQCAFALAPCNLVLLFVIVIVVILVSFFF